MNTDLIVDLLKDEDYSARLTCGDRWLVVNSSGDFVVYARARRQGKIVYEGDDVGIAIVYLKGFPNK